MTNRQAAPPELEPIRAFINSMDLESSKDSLEEWCATSPLCDSAALPEAEKLRAFREALRGVLEANAGDRDARLAWSALEPFARETSYRIRVDAAGPPALDPLGHGAEGTIAALLAIVYDAVRRGLWPRLKACRKSSCRWAYYDRSKNASSAWCSMAVCGNRMKASRRRQKQGKSSP